MNPNVRKKNLVLLLVLFCFVALMYFITMAKIGG